MDGIRASLSGIQAGLLRQRVAAVNVAGSILPDRTPLRMDAFSVPGGGVDASVRPDARDEASFSESAIELLRAEREVALNARALRRQDEAHDALLEALDGVPGHGQTENSTASVRPVV